MIDQNITPSQRRLKLISVDAMDILRFLSGDRCYRLSCTDLPLDHEIIGCDIDRFLNPPVFTFVVYHPSFDVVPVNEHPPRIAARWEMIQKDGADQDQSDSWRDKPSML